LTALFEYISGSDRFKSEYDQVLRERDAAKEDANFLEKKRKGLKVEQREYKDQKKEADVHAQWSAELTLLKRRSLMCQLFYIGQDIEELEKELESKKVEAANVGVKLIEGEKKIPGLRKNHAIVLKAFESLERDLKSHEKTLGRIKPELVVKENELVHVRRKVEMLQKEVEDAKRKLEIFSLKRVQLEKELSDLEAAELAFRKENEEAMALSGKQLSEAELKEFAQIKEKSRTQTSEKRSRLSSLEREQESDVSMFEELHKPRMNDLEEKLRQMEDEELPSAKRKLAMIESLHGSLCSDRDAFEKERVSIQSENVEILKAKEKCEEELELLQEELKKVRVDMSESERQTKMEDCIQSMRRLFPGVHGRIIDLVEPSQDRYRPALTVALGANMDAIVVSDKNTAIECISYMKEQRIGVATFIPLDSIRTGGGSSYDRLRLLEPGVIKPIIDVLKYDPSYQSAMEFVCGNTLVCADLDKAREWAFHSGSGKRYKVVTFDGMLIAKSGFMTGGIVGRDSRAQRWDVKKVSDLKNRRDVELAKLNDINASMRNVARERELQNLIATLDAKISAHVIDRDMAQKMRDSIEKSIKDAKRKLETNRAAYAQMKASIDERSPKIDVLKRETAAIEDALFAKFSSRVGIPNIREWEETRKVRLKSLAEKGLMFKTQRARIQNLLDYAIQQEERSVGSDEHLETQLDEMRGRLKTLEKEISEIQSEMKEKSDSLKEMKEEYEEKRKEMESSEKTLKEATRDAESRKVLKNAMLKWIESKETLMEQLKAKRHQVLESAKVDDVKLPLLEEEEEEDKKVMMDVDEPEHGDDDDFPSLKATQSMTTQEVIDRTRKEDHINIDFESLEKEFKQFKTPSQREEMLSSIVADIQSVSAKIDSIAPNYKAIDRLDVVGESIEKIDSDIDAAHQRAEQCRQRYLQIREQRKKTFMDAFSTINDNINAVYKALTGGFGQAHLENAVEDPYAHPVTYSLAPKSKAFTDIQHLSGGEQSVAALALLFAIQCVRPSPFFVLDEIDAALDSDNVGVVAEYFKQRSNSMQFIVISLKDKCFEKADALVGIFQDRTNKTSKSITLDLNAMCGGPYQPAK
jgi:structural maintenance of chromosome 1